MQIKKETTRVVAYTCKWAVIAIFQTVAVAKLGIKRRISAGVGCSFTFMIPVDYNLQLFLMLV